MKTSQLMMNGYIILFFLSYIQTTQTHSDAVCIIYGCLFIVVHKGTIGLMRVNLCWKQLDNFLEVLSRTVGGHTVSVLR